MLPSALRRLLRQLSATVLLITVALVAAAVPTRPVWVSVWPERIEEVVHADGQWLLQPARRSTGDHPSEDIRARTRPISLVKARLSDDRVYFGFVMEQLQTSEGEQWLLSIGPEEEVRVDSADIVEWIYPNALGMVEQLRLACARLISRTPSPH